MVTIEEAQSNKELMDIFISENMGLVKSAIRKYGFPLTDDYMQEGAIGLIKAARRFDTNRGVTFSTYAVPMIVGQLRVYNRSYASGDVTSGMIVSRELKAIYYKSLKYEGYSDAEICRELNITTKQLQDARLAMDGCLSLDKTTHNHKSDDKSTEIHEFIPSKVNIEDEVMDKMFIEELLNFAKQEVGEQGYDVLRLYLGGKTQVQVSQTLGNISQVDVSRMLRRIIKSYKKHLEGGSESDMKITTEQLINECRAHGTNIRAMEYIAEKYNMSIDSVRNTISRKGIKHILENELAAKQEQVISASISEREASALKTVKAWGGKENIYSFQDGKLVISNKEGVLPVTDIRTMILELQELAGKQIAV